MPAADSGLSSADFVPVLGQDVAPRLPHERRPGILHVGRLGVDAPLVDRAVAVGVLGQLLADLDHLVPGPGVVGVGDPGRVEHVLVVVERDDIEVARQAEHDAVLGREVLDGVVVELAEVVVLGLDVRSQVEQHVAALVVGTERPVHREHVRGGAARQAGLELVPVGLPVGHRHVHGDVGVRGREPLDDGLLAVDLGRIAPDRVLDLDGRSRVAGGRALASCHGGGGRARRAGGGRGGRGGRGGPAARPREERHGGGRDGQAAQPRSVACEHRCPPPAAHESQSGADPPSHSGSHSSLGLDQVVGQLPGLVERQAGLDDWIGHHGVVDEVPVLVERRTDGQLLAVDGGSRVGRAVGRQRADRRRLDAQRVDQTPGPRRRRRPRDSR